MFAESKENAKMVLQGRVLKGFSVILLSILSFMFFFLSSLCCIYYLIIDTSFLSDLGIFENQYLHAAVCAFAVIENIVLFMFAIYIKLRKEIYFYFSEEYYVNKRISAKTVFKAVSIYTFLFVKKTTGLILFLLPAATVFMILLNQLQLGISVRVLSVLIVFEVILLLTGLYSCAAFFQKYHLLTYVLLKNENAAIREIFALSEKKMNGKNKELLKLKIINLPKKFISALIFPAIYFLPYCKATEADFVLQNEKPYMRRKAYTEKPIVFYFTPVKEN